MIFQLETLFLNIFNILEIVFAVHPLRNDFITFANLLMVFKYLHYKTNH